MKIIKILEFHARITKVMKIIKLNVRIIELKTKFIISLENHEHHENHRIPVDNQENH